MLYDSKGQYRRILSELFQASSTLESITERDKLIIKKSESLASTSIYIPK